MAIFIGNSGVKTVKNIYVGVSNTPRKVINAYVGVNGAPRKFYMAGTLLGDLAIGAIVKISVSNTVKSFIVVQQGRPSSMYDTGWANATILLMEDIYEERQWHSSAVNDYANSTIHSYLNGTFPNLLSLIIRNALISVKLPYRAGSGTGTTITSGANGLAAKVFLLSGYEVGFTTSDNQYFVADGVRFSYFENSTGASALVKRIAYLYGTASHWWLRSPSINTSGDVGVVAHNGNWGSNLGHNLRGVRPALALPSSLLVSNDGTIST